MIEVDTGAAPVRAIFTTRRGGVSVGPYGSLNLGATVGDDAGAVRRNREAVARAVGCDHGRVAALTQVHGASVVTAGATGGGGTFTGSLDGLAEADALVTREPGVALCAMGADCPVVLMWHEEGAVVAAAHAGWRGIVAGVIGEAISAMGVPASGVSAAVGPHVGACCYPVDHALRGSMAEAFGDDVVRGDAVDLGLACRRALERAGVAGTRIAVESACTSCDAARFFSYRRDGAATGRQAGMICIGVGG